VLPSWLTLFSLENKSYLKSNINNLSAISSVQSTKVLLEMSKRKRKKDSPMPAASAGLLRFFEEETEGVKVKPEMLLGLAVALIIVCILAHVFF